MCILGLIYLLMCYVYPWSDLPIDVLCVSLVWFTYWCVMRILGLIYLLMCYVYPWSDLPIDVLCVSLVWFTYWCVMRILGLIYLLMCYVYPWSDLPIDVLCVSLVWFTHYVMCYVYPILGPGIVNVHWCKNSEEFFGIWFCIIFCVIKWAIRRLEMMQSSAKVWSYPNYMYP